MRRQSLSRVSVPKNPAHVEHEQVRLTINRDANGKTNVLPFHQTVSALALPVGVRSWFPS
jgi:hypothetical protein